MIEREVLPSNEIVRAGAVIRLELLFAPAESVQSHVGNERQHGKGLFLEHC